MSEYVSVTIGTVSGQGIGPVAVPLDVATRLQVWFQTGESRTFTFIARMPTRIKDDRIRETTIAVTRAHAEWIIMEGIYDE